MPKELQELWELWERFDTFEKKILDKKPVWRGLKGNMSGNTDKHDVATKTGDGSFTAQTTKNGVTKKEYTGSRKAGLNEARKQKKEAYAKAGPTAKVGFTAPTTLGQQEDTPLTDPIAKPHPHNLAKLYKNRKREDGASKKNRKRN